MQICTSLQSSRHAYDWYARTFQIQSRPRPTAPESIGPVAWGEIYGTWGETDGDGNAAKLDRASGGFLTGIDGAITQNIRLGLVAGYGHSAFDVDERAASGSSDNVHLGLYGGGRWDALRLSGGLAYTWHAIETNRAAAFSGFADNLSADYTAATFQAFGEAGYRIETAATTVEPFAGLAHVSLRTNAFAEEGGAAALLAADRTTATTFATLGVHASRDFDLRGMSATAHSTLVWRQAFGDTVPLSTHAFAGGDTFTIAGVPIAKDAAIIEAGLELDMTDNATLGVSYSGQIARDAQDHGFGANLAVRF
ncbi:autotransporter domain-containing protein [uncultured Nitratireductor sp.]|uniref:autotransporter outer membrane beta-barrel domain-containing protein n=1 Tax=uncultured Nitratireductor sp. TaxID=520953 RepID=UPI0025EBE695|nr:autotransporter domain-containing protein [uncultured Nitratireductor sp.]